MLLRALTVASFLLLAACAGEVPCSDLSEGDCLDDELCAAEYLESCGCSCDDPACDAGCCEFDVCTDAD